MSATTLGPRTARAVTSELDVERTGIRFWSPTPDRVRIEVEVHNRGAGWSAPTSLTLRAAPFGAFVPWTPLTELDVGPIAPFASRVVATELPRPKAPRVADLSDFVPPRVITAVSAGGREPEPRPELRRSPQWRRSGLIAMAMVRMMRMSRPEPGVLPADFYELLGKRTPHWAGNVNVLIGRKSVERHMVQALRIHPGRANVAMFLLGPDPKGYVLRVEGDAVAWKHSLFDGARGTSLLCADGTNRLEGGAASGQVLFACRPPADCTRGTAEVHVTRRSRGDEAVVEFSLDADAAGPGCYSV